MRCLANGIQRTASWGGAYDGTDSSEHGNIQHLTYNQLIKILIVTPDKYCLDYIILFSTDLDMRLP